MECSDCKKYRKCESPLKDELDAAYWCLDYKSKYKDQQVKVGKFLIIQSGLNHHLAIVDKETEQIILHVNCTKRLTKKELIDYLEYRLGTGDVLPPSSFDCEEWHDEFGGDVDVQSH